MAKKHVERFLTPLVIREIQAKTSEIPFHTYQTRKKNLENWSIFDVGEEMEPQKAS